jgi:hypothetical protein
MQLSYSSAQTRGHKIVDHDDISIYMPEELERLESLRGWEFVHTRVYDVILLKKGEMDVDLPTLFHTIGWSLWWDFGKVHYWWRGWCGHQHQRYNHTYTKIRFLVWLLGLVRTN